MKKAIFSLFSADNAPVTKAFVVTSALFTIFAGIQGRSSSTLGLSYQVPIFHICFCSFFRIYVFISHEILVGSLVLWLLELGFFVSLFGAVSVSLWPFSIFLHIDALFFDFFYMFGWFRRQMSVNSICLICNWNRNFFLWVLILLKIGSLKIRLFFRFW